LGNEEKKAKVRAGGTECQRAAASLTARLGRVEGQVRALRRMIEEGEPCEEVAVQLAAATSALRRAAFAFFAYRMRECTRGRSEEGESIEKLGDMFVRLG
jgi:DNA-binding FrmR family transcriptional regulator